MAKLCSSTTRKLCDDAGCLTCFNRSFASSPRVENWSSNNPTVARKVFKSSHKKYDFDCECGHKFSMSPNSITNANSWCPFCANKQLCTDINCLTCFNKSFASSPRAERWSLDNVTIPRKVFKNDSQKYDFNCECGHKFSTSLGSITSGERWCPFCANKQLCTDINCLTCFNKSFASSPRAERWSSNNPTVARKVSKNDHQKYDFGCECGHKFSMSPNSITASGQWCPFCANKQLCDDTDCLICFNKSFASSPRAESWSSDNSDKIRKVFKSSNKKYVFNCSNKHKFSTQPNNIKNGNCAKKSIEINSSVVRPGNIYFSLKR